MDLVQINTLVWPTFQPLLGHFKGNNDYNWLQNWYLNRLEAKEVEDNRMIEVLTSNNMTSHDIGRSSAAYRFPYIFV